MNWGRNLKEKDSKKRGAELSIWEEEPRGQFSFSYTGKRESIGGMGGGGWKRWTECHIGIGILL